MTTYWTRDPTPRAPGRGRCFVGEYRPPASELPGAQTFVEDPDGSAPTDNDAIKEDREKEQALPSPPWSRSKPTGPIRFNGPGPSGTGPDGKTVHKDKARTQSKPGDRDDETHPYPDPRTSPQRRPDIYAAIGGPPYPGGNRQKKQRGPAKLYSRTTYRRNRARVRSRMRRWYTRWKNRSQYKRDIARRRKAPERFERRPPGYAKPEDRTQDWRDKQKKAGFAPVPFIDVVTGESGTIHGVTVNDGMADITVGGNPNRVLLDYLLKNTFVPDEAALDRLFVYLDAIFEYEETETPEPDDAGAEEEDRPFTEWLSRVRVAAWHMAEMIERHPPEDFPADQKYDRAMKPYWWKERNRDPAQTLDDAATPDNPGSAKVIPTNHDFVNNTSATNLAASIRIAMRMGDILRTCGEDVVYRSKGLGVKLRRVDAKNHSWLFDVAGSTDTYRVRVKALPKGNVTSAAKADVFVSCSCPFWQWQGPEHWARERGYLFGKPRGTASEPVVKDPRERHGACKHVLAVFRQMERYFVPERARIKRVAAHYLINRFRLGR